MMKIFPAELSRLLLRKCTRMIRKRNMQGKFADTLPGFTSSRSLIFWQVTNIYDFIF